MSQYFDYHQHCNDLRMWMGKLFNNEYSEIAMIQINQLIDRLEEEISELENERDQLQAEVEELETRIENF